MSVTGRDRKILIAFVAAAAIAAYWFLLLAPKRDEAVTAAKALATEEQRRDAALASIAELEAAKLDFSTDYAALVRLGKAIPSSLDAASLILQVQRAAHGTRINFDEIASEQADGASTPTATPPSGGSSPVPPDGTATPAGSSTPPGGSTARPADAGGAAAQSAPGKASESAGNAVNGANAQSGAAAAETGVAPADAETSQSAREGSVPVGGGSASGGAGPEAGNVPSPTAAGLQSVPFNFNFSGSFFDLADLFHELKRHVQVVDEQIAVRGRLMTIDGLRMSAAGDGSSADLTVEVDATVYLTPKAEGPTAGATPQEPSRVVPQGGPGTEQASGSPPTATVAP